MLNEKAESVKCFELKKLGKNQAVFLKTADNCYFITYFIHMVVSGSSNVVTLIIKDFTGNKSQKGEKACFGKTIEPCDESVKVGKCFTYNTAQGSVKTAKVEEVVFGFFEDVERRFLETLKKMLEVKDCPESSALVS